MSVKSLKPERVKVSFRLDIDIVEWLEEMAKTANMTVSEYLRMILNSVR